MEVLVLKNDIDFSRLKLYGFTFNNNTGKYVNNIDDISSIEINSWNRKVVWSTNSIEVVLKLFDLITAGLLTKIKSFELIKSKGY